MSYLKKHEFYDTKLTEHDRQQGPTPLTIDQHVKEKMEKDKQAEELKKKQEE